MSRRKTKQKNTSDLKNLILKTPDLIPEFIENAYLDSRSWKSGGYSDKSQIILQLCLKSSQIVRFLTSHVLLYAAYLN